jgi:TRAP-type C4-dicarboxylate transport system permease small subunit
MNNVIYGLARLMAWFGAAVLTLIAAVTVVSIVGRALSGFGLGPVPGDFELVEVGTALAVFCFMPWCHLKRGHAVVDLLWSRYPPALQRLLDILSEVLMFTVWVLLIWRMWVGMMEYRENQEVSFILQMPVWWGYAASMPAAIIGCIAYAWRFIESLGLGTPPKGFVTGSEGH